MTTTKPICVLILAHFMTAGSMAAAEPAGDLLDILVVAPHSDDEAIGCAGVMMIALAEGKRVGVVIVTNGDGFAKAAAAISKKPENQLVAADYIALTGLRQKHSIVAMKSLGLRADDLMFLGYPDNPLDKVYEATGSEPARSPFTGKAETYGAVEPDYHTKVHGKPAPYTKSAVVGDLAEIIGKRKPKEIYVTHEADPPAPGDHQIAFCFTRDAIRAAGWRGELWAYLVHGIDRVRPSEPMRRVELTPAQFARKRALIEMYQAGMSPVHDRLAEKYTRSEERFWKIKVE